MFSKISKSVLRVTLKHLPGQHNQKRHGWRYGNVGGIKRGLRGEESNEYSVRARMRAGATHEEAVRAKIFREEAKIRALPNEKFIAFNKNGEIIFSKGGDKDSVNFTEDEVDAMKKFGGDDLIYTHNHPSSLAYAPGTPGSLGSSLGQHDVYFGKQLNAKELRAVSADGSVYVMKRPSQGWPKNIYSFYGISDRNVRSAIYPKINDGSMTVETANRIHFDEVNKEFVKLMEAEGYDIKYYKEMLPEAYRRKEMTEWL